jgi:hypothetical protein
MQYEDWDEEIAKLESELAKIAIGKSEIAPIAKALLIIIQMLESIGGRNADKNNYQN